MVTAKMCVGVKAGVTVMGDHAQQNGAIASAKLSTTMEEIESEMSKETIEEKEKEMERIGQESFDNSVKIARYNRLRLLLEQTEHYSRFLSERIETQRSEAQKKEEAKERKSKKQKASPKKGGKAKRDDQYSIATAVENIPVSGNHENTKAEDTAKQHEDNEQMLMNLSDDEIRKRQPKLITGTLRGYQLVGVEWMVSLWQNGLNGILGDEMGLGKTLQCIGFICHMIEHGVKGPYMIVAPLSTLSNWINEFKRFAPDVPVILYHGSKQEREQMRRKMRGKEASKTIKGPNGESWKCLPIIITSYEITMRDREALEFLRLQYIIVDEGHRLKNMNCKLIRELRKYANVNRLLLTGTPLQNNLSELWSLLNFLLPDVFDDLETFQNWFDFSDLSHDQGKDREFIDREQKDGVLQKLHSILKPFLLRRLKIHVAKLLPKKKEIIIWSGMAPAQMLYYAGAVAGNLEAILHKEANALRLERGDEVVKKRRGTDGEADELPSKRRKKDVTYVEMGDREYFQRLENGTLPTREEEPTPVNKSAGSVVVESNVKVTNLMMLLRKICNHPYLLSYPLHKNGEYKVDEALVKSSGKFQILDALLPRLLAQNRKVLIFSQMTSMLDVLHDYLFMRGIRFCRLDGSTSMVDRAEQIESFDDAEGPSVFLLSTRAGGLGINLVAADTVIIYDSDWNPQVDLQAQDRVHRLGQKNPVIIYRLVTPDSIEKKIFERANAKRKLEKVVIHKEKFKSIPDGAKQKQMSITEMKALLESELSYRKTREGEVTLTEDDILQLLDRSDAAFEKPAQQGQDTTGSVVDPQDDAAASQTDDVELDLASTITRDGRKVFSVNAVE